MKITLGSLAIVLVLFLGMGCTLPSTPASSTTSVDAKAVGPRDARLVFHMNTGSRSVHTLGEIGFLTVQLLSSNNETVRFGKAAKSAVQPDPYGVDFVVDFPQLEAGAWKTRVLLYDKEAGTLLFYSLQTIPIFVGQTTSVPALAVYEPGSVAGVTFVEALPPDSVSVDDQYFRSAPAGSPVEWPLGTTLSLRARVDSASVDGGTGLALPALDQRVKWTTNQPQVATVDAQGQALAVGIGSALVTATSVFDPSVSAQFAVTVVPGAVGTWSGLGPDGRRALVSVTAFPGSTVLNLTLYNQEAQTYGATLSGALRTSATASGWIPESTLAFADASWSMVYGYSDHQAVAFPDPMTMTLDKEDWLSTYLPPPMTRMALPALVFARQPDFRPVTTLTPVAVTANLVAGQSFLFSVAADGLATFHDGSLLSWGTDDPAVLSVSPDGLVRGRAPGTANVVVRSLDPVGTSLSFGVTVSAGPSAPVVETLGPTLVLGPGLPGGTGWFNAVEADLSAPGWILAGSAGGSDRFNPAGLLLTRLTLSGKTDASFGAGNGVSYEPGVNAWGLAQDPQAPHDIVVQTDGGSYGTTFLWRYQSSGHLKPGYGVGGHTLVPFTLYTEAEVQTPVFGPNGDLVVLGRPSGYSNNFSVVKATAQGDFTTLWTSATSQWTKGLAMEPNGNVVLSEYAGIVARVGPNGSDSSFGFHYGGQDYHYELDPPGNEASMALPSVAVDPQHRAYVAGNFWFNGAPRVFVARLTAEGTLDQTYGGSDGEYNHPGYLLLPADCQVAVALRLQPDGSVVVGGNQNSLAPPHWLAVVAPEGTGLSRQVTLAHPGWTGGLVTSVAVDAAGNIGVAGFVDGTPNQPVFWMVAK